MPLYALLLCEIVKLLKNLCRETGALLSAFSDTVARIRALPVPKPRGKTPDDVSIVDADETIC